MEKWPTVYTVYTRIYGYPIYMGWAIPSRSICCIHTYSSTCSVLSRRQNPFVDRGAAARAPLQLNQIDSPESFDKCQYSRSASLLINNFRLRSLFWVYGNQLKFCCCTKSRLSSRKGWADQNLQIVCSKILSFYRFKSACSYFQILKLHVTH